MIGVPINAPYWPGLVIVNVPSLTSSGVSFLFRARSPRSLMAWQAQAGSSHRHFLMTGTISPHSRFTAMPILIARL